MKDLIIRPFKSRYVYIYAHMKISLNADTWCALVLTVINVEGVGLQNISVISACSVAQCCGNSAGEKQTVSVEPTL